MIDLVYNEDGTCFDIYECADQLLSALIEDREDDFFNSESNDYTAADFDDVVGDLCDQMYDDYREQRDANRVSPA